MIRFLQINKPLSQLLHLLFTRKMEKPIMKCISHLLVSMSLVVILCSFEIYKLGRTQRCCICVYQSFIFSQQTFINLLCCMCLVVQSCPTLVTPQTVACLVPLPMGFSRQEYWSRCHFLPGIFLIQEQNQDLLHCSQTLQQLSYKGSRILKPNTKSSSW